jgi:hypothetical protein
MQLHRRAGVDDTEWRCQLRDHAAAVSGTSGPEDKPPVDLKALHAKIGQQAMEIDFLVRRARQSEPIRWRGRRNCQF